MKTLAFVVIYTAIFCMVRPVIKGLFQKLF